VFGSGLEEKYETGLIDGEQFHEEFCRLTNSQTSKDKLLLAASDIFVANVAIFPLLAQLRARGFPIGILSNTCQAHWDYVQTRYLVLRDFFSPHILSYEVKSMKPNAKIYQRAVEQAGCEFQRCFFVDDRPENVAGAISAGMDAVLYHSVAELACQLARRGVNVNF
jgi:putative hydrolase of the HAD superfamily